MKITGDAMIPLDISYGKISPGVLSVFIRLYIHQNTNCIWLIVSSRQAVTGTSIRCFERQSFVWLSEIYALVIMMAQKRYLSLDPRWLVFVFKPIHAMHNALFALGTWKRVVSKQGRWLNPKFIFAILCFFLSEYNPKKYLKWIFVRAIFLELRKQMATDLWNLPASFWCDSRGIMHSVYTV